MMFTLREAYTTWNECSENNIVPEHKIKTLFGELKLFLHEDQGIFVFFKW